MPEQIGKTNMVKVLKNEFFITTDNTKVNGPLTVRVHELNLDVIHVQAGPGTLYEVKGKTIEDFIKSVG